LVGFRRQIDDSSVVIIAARKVAKLLLPGSIRLDASKLVNNYVALQHAQSLKSAFDPNVSCDIQRASVADLLRQMPFAVLVSPDLL
jgi:maltooligosyltrehalose synthase